MDLLRNARPRTFAASAALALALAVAPLGAQAAGPPGPGPAATIVAGGLIDPRFVAIGGDGTLYVTEAGTGGSEQLPALPGPPGPPGTRGTTGQVSKVAPDGTKTVIAKGLPSYNQEGAVGPAGIAVAGGALWVSIGGGAVGANAQGAKLKPLPNESSLVRIDPQTGDITQIADLGAYETANNPDGNNVDSNPYGLALGPDGNVYVDDAGGNVVYKVSPSGGPFGVAQVVHPLPLPSGVQLPPGGNPELGGKSLLDAVPTDVAFGPGGAMYISLLTGFPFPPGAAKVLRVGADGKQADYATGLTMVTAIAFGPDGLLYATEISRDFSPTEQGKPPAPGDVVRIHPDGTKDVVAANLIAPNGLAIDAAGNLFVLNNTVTLGPPGTPPAGQVLKYAGVAAGGHPAAVTNPRLHAADSLGRALWATQHGGDPAGYDRVSRHDQITWNSVAIHGH